jgi:pilus assembly protein CpaB
LIAIGGLFLIAVGIFVVVGFLNFGGATNTAPTPTPVAEVKFLVAFATNDVEEGMVLTSEDVTLAEVPVQFAPRDAITNLEEAVGRMSKTDLFEGEMILEHNLADPTNQAFDVAYILDDNHVLMAIPPSDLMSSLSMVQRGDIIDIMVSFPATLTQVDEGGVPVEGTEGESDVVTFTARQRLNVTAIIVEIVADEEPQNNATPGPPSREETNVLAYLIALDPQEALVLKYLKDAGGIFDFVIRAPTSTGQFDLTPVTSKYIKELYGLDLLP